MTRHDRDNTIPRRTPASAIRTVRNEIRQVLLFLGLIWLVFLIDCFVPISQRWGLVPRQWEGLVGIITMPLLHRDLGHLFGNTVPLLVLLTLLAGSRARSWQIVLSIWLAGGSLLWLAGRNGTETDPQAHVGASLLVFGLIAFLIGSGIMERRPVPLLVSFVVLVLYGTSLVTQVLPFRPGVSWDGHACGALAGFATAYVLARPSPRTAPGVSAQELSP